MLLSLKTTHVPYVACLFLDLEGCQSARKAMAREHSTLRLWPGCPPLRPSSRGWDIGRLLYVIVHQHFVYRMHYVWNGAFGNRCFERLFMSYVSLSDFCTTTVTQTPDGLCSCIMVREGALGNMEGCAICCTLRWASAAGRCSLTSLHPAQTGRPKVDNT